MILRHYCPNGLVADRPCEVYRVMLLMCAMETPECMQLRWHQRLVTISQCHLGCICSGVRTSKIFSRSTTACAKVFRALPNNRGEATSSVRISIPSWNRVHLHFDATDFVGYSHKFHPLNILGSNKSTSCKD